VYWIASDGKIWDVNDAALNMLGYAREQFIAMTIPDIDQNISAERWQLHWEDLKQKGSLQLETQHRTIDGRIIPVEMIANYCRYKNVEYNCAIVRDIADRKQLEEQLRQSQKMEAVGLLAGGVAHDFNNILMVIMGYGNILKKDHKLDERQHEKIDQILCSAEKAAHLTKGLLAFSRKQILTQKPINLNEITQNVAIFIGRIIGEDIQLKTTTYGEGLTIYADAGQIEQVLINLATNARDAMPKGGLLTIETGLQVVEAPGGPGNRDARPGRYAVVAVSDTGCGMDEETGKRIFEPFFTTKPQGKGTGLGLATVHGIVKQHEGWTTVYSEEGLGTTFKIHLPAVEDAEPAAAVEVEAHIAPGRNENILLIEDDPQVRYLTCLLLKRHGYRVTDVGLCAEALAAFSGGFDLVLSDMVLPDGNGLEMVRQLQRQCPRLRCVLTSGYADIHERWPEIEKNSWVFLHKPFNRFGLLRAVAGALTRV